MLNPEKEIQKKINRGNVSCIICKKNFKSAHGLYEHYRAKHSNMIEHPTSLFNKEINGNTTLLESISHPVTKGIPIAEHDKKYHPLR
ncbi:hypothetical protein ACQ41E_004803 [Escherichia coli]